MQVFFFLKVFYCTYTSKRTRSTNYLVFVSLSYRYVKLVKSNLNMFKISNCYYDQILPLILHISVILSHLGTFCTYLLFLTKTFFFFPVTVALVVIDNPTKSNVFKIKIFLILVPFSVYKSL